jgi:hypothetical protein
VVSYERNKWHSHVLLENGLGKLTGVLIVTEGRAAVAGPTERIVNHGFGAPTALLGVAEHHARLSKSEQTDRSKCGSAPCEIDPSLLVDLYDLHRVVAGGRDATKAAAALGDHDNLLALKLDVTRPEDAQAAIEAAVAKSVARAQLPARSACSVTCLLASTASLRLTQPEREIADVL